MKRGIDNLVALKPSVAVGEGHVADFTASAFDQTDCHHVGLGNSDAIPNFAFGRDA